MDNIMGMDFSTLRIISIVGMICVVILFAYKIACLVDLMKSESETMKEFDRLVYAGLIVFLPLGIGAWIYEYVTKGKKYSRLFLYPFSIALLTSLYAMVVVMPHATQFNLDYLTW
jgi:hypothetical protein